MRYLGLFFLTFLLVSPSEADFRDGLRAFLNACMGGPHRFATDKEASSWLLVQRERAGLTPDEKELLTQWPAQDISRRVNEKLRAGEVPDRERVISSHPRMTTGMILDLFDRLHATLRTNRSMITYRGLGATDLGAIEVGKIIEDPGYMNLSLRRESPEIWARHHSPSDPVILELEIPKGYPIVPVGRIGSIWGELQGGELAVVPKRGTRFKITQKPVREGSFTIVRGRVLP